jgi:hypothetical protein
MPFILASRRIKYFSEESYKRNSKLDENHKASPLKYHKEVQNRMNSTVIYCRNFCGCHSVPPI